MKLILIFLVLFATSIIAKAELAEDKARIGFQAGNVGLLKDVGDNAGNAIGLGVITGYHVVEDILVEAGWVHSSHDDLKHDEYSFGAMYYIDGADPIYWNAGAGLAFIDHEYTKGGENLSDVGFALYAATGVDIFLKKRLVTGLQARYYKAFEVEKKNAAGTLDIPIIQDFYTVMFRLQFIF